MHAVGDAPTDPFAALRVGEFRRFLFGNFLATFGWQMQTMAVGWELYERTRQTLHLGLIGLVQILPGILLALPVGHIVDRSDRRNVMRGALLTVAAGVLGLAAVSHWELHWAWMYVGLFVIGVARAFLQPARSALVPTIVPRVAFANAVTWNTSAFHLATVVAPWLAGKLIHWTHSARNVYLIDVTLILCFLGVLGTLAARPPAAAKEPLTARSLLAGLSFVWRTKLILGAISLDMFAVLLGGATALLPAFSRDILHGGPEELGLLRAAPGLGALAMSLVIAVRPPLRRAGPALLWSVAGFGVATIVFGVARSLPLAWAMLFLTGALDQISVVIRHTLVQMWTPDAMRGRVSAVNGMFIGISNELGAFESGYVAHLFHRSSDLTFGPTMSVVTGGIGTLVVVLLTAWQFPEVRRYDAQRDAPP